MKLNFILLASVLLLGCMSENKSEGSQKDANAEFFVGTYTNKGDSEGIYKYRLSKDGVLDSIRLAVKTTNPSYITHSYDEKFLVTVNQISDENGVGRIELYKYEGDQLIKSGSGSSGGANPCFVSAGSNGYIACSNYAGGNVGLLKIENNRLSTLLDVKQHVGGGEHPRQDKAHAHSIWFVPKCNDIIAVDLGTNELWFYQIDSINNVFVAKEQAKLELPLQSGPRHLTFHPNGKYIYVLNELSGSVSVVSKGEDGNYKLGQTFSTLPEGFNDFNKSADIHISSNGKYLYASNRGPNTIAIFKVDDETGKPILVGFESTRGDGPRNFVLSPDENFLLVANQHSNNIVSFKRDKESGLLEFVSEINAPSPVCLLFDLN